MVAFRLRRLRKSTPLVDRRDALARNQISTERDALKKLVIFEVTGSESGCRLRGLPFEHLEDGGTAPRFTVGGGVAFAV